MPGIASCGEFGVFRNLRNDIFGSVGRDDDQLHLNEHLGRLIFGGLHTAMNRPGSLRAIDPMWRNFFENPKTVQFAHRCGAYLIALMALAHAAQAMSIDPGTTHSRRSLVLAALVLAQAGLGVVTLMSQAGLHPALAHQALALIALAFAVAHWRAAKGGFS